MAALYPIVLVIQCLSPTFSNVIPIACPYCCFFRPHVWTHFFQGFSSRSESKTLGRRSLSYDLNEKMMIH